MVVSLAALRDRRLAAPKALAALRDRRLAAPKALAALRDRRLAAPKALAALRDRRLAAPKALRFSCAVLVLASACGRARDDPAPAAAPSDVVEVDAAREPEPPTAASDPSISLPGPDDTPPTHFEGREIAPTMSHLGADWLTRAERDAEENTTLLHQALALRPGDTACDMGAGNGYHTVRLAQAVGPKGRVLAVDLQPRMLELLRERVAEAGLHNVETIEATDADPRLPAGTCDLILLVDVYHELSWPEPMLAAFRRALAPGGRLALVEFRAEDPDVPIKPLHKMSKAQIDRELLPRGFVRVQSFDELPWQHLLLFERDDRAGR